MQNRPPPPVKSHLFAPSGNKKGKGRPAPTSVTHASRAHPAAPMKPQPPPPPPPLPLASMNASGSGSGPPLAPSPQSHRPPSNNHHAGPPPPAGQARPLSALATPDIRRQVSSAMKLLASIARDQQDRDYLESAYEWPDLADEERNALNAKLDTARQAEMAQRDKTIEGTFSKLSNDMIALFTALVEHATSSRLEGLVRRCDAQQKRIDDLEAQKAASSTTTSTSPAAAAANTSAAAATVAAAQQKRIDDLERKLNTLVQAQAQAHQTTSSSSPRPAAAPPGRPHAFTPAAAAGSSASPPGTPIDPTSAPADLNATYKELRDKYRYVGNEVRAQKTRIDKLDHSVGELQKKLAGHSEEAAGTTGGGGEVVKGLEKRLEKVEQALVVATQQPQQSGAGGAGGEGTVDPRRRPSSTTPADAQVPAAAAAAAAEVAALRADVDALTSTISTHLGKRPHDGVDGADSGADHPHKAAKSNEGARPASSSSAAAARDDEQQQQLLLKERLQKVEERLEGCEKKVTALRSDVDKDGSRIDATVVNVTDLEKKDKERAEREQAAAAAAAAPPVSKGGSSTSDMDLDKSDQEDQKAKANAEKFDVLERRIQQMEASGSPELLIEPVKNEVAELRKLFDERVPSPNTLEDPKNILACIRNLEQSVARSSASAAPVLETMHSFVGTAADGSALPADQVRSKLLDTLIRVRDDLQRHGTSLASHDQSIKSLVKASEDTDSKFEALEGLASLLSEALPQLRDLYLVVCRAQEMNLFPKTATLFPNANANANANATRLAIRNGSHGSPTPGVSTTTAAAAASAAPNWIANGATGNTGSTGSGANPAPPQPNGIVGVPPPAPTANISSTPAAGATTGANAAAQGRPSTTPAAAPSTSTSTSTNPSSLPLPQRPQQPHGQQQRPGSANGSSSGATPRTIPTSLPPRPQ